MIILSSNTYPCTSFGNHDIDKPERVNNIFPAFEIWFRMPRIQEAQLGTYNGEEGQLNMDSPPYPLNDKYENAYYAFQVGETHQIYLNSYSSLDPVPSNTNGS